MINVFVVEYLDTQWCEKWLLNDSLETIDSIQVQVGAHGSMVRTRRRADWDPVRR
jgi:hypothetical protein